MSKNTKKTLSEVVEHFMMSQTYKEMQNAFEDKEFKKIQSKFFNMLENITAIATENNELETKKIENLVIAYLAKIEVMGVLIGFQFAFNLFSDLQSFNLGGEVDV